MKHRDRIRLHRLYRRYVIRTGLGIMGEPNYAFQYLKISRQAHRIARYIKHLKQNGWRR